MKHVLISHSKFIVISRLVRGRIVLSASGDTRTKFFNIWINQLPHIEIYPRWYIREHAPISMDLALVFGHKLVLHLRFSDSPCIYQARSIQTTNDVYFCDNKPKPRQ